MRSPLSFVRRFGLTHPTRFPSLHLPAFRPIFRAAVRIADVFRFPHFYFRLAPRACLAGALAAFAWRAEGAADEPASSAPTDYVSRSWITDHGLPHNVVTRVQQDHVGYLWLATLAGLTRFDGREFKVFPVPTDSARVREPVSAELTRVAEVDQAALRRDGALQLRQRRRQPTEGLDPHYSDSYIPTEVDYLAYDEPGGTPRWTTLGRLGPAGA